MIARVALPLPIDKIFSYSLPHRLAILARPFSRVEVPFANRSLVGFIVSLDEVGQGDEEGLKPVRDILDPVPLVDAACFRLCEWSSIHYVRPVGLALRFALPSAIKTERYCVVRTTDSSLLALDNRLLRIAYATFGKDVVFDHLSRGTIRLCDMFTGTAVACAEEPEHGEFRGGGFRKELYLGPAEERLDYYASLVASQLDSGRSTLMLLPDRHGAGEFFLHSLSKRFPESLLWYGSEMPEKKRAEAYFRAKNEKARLILGSKSCIFLPVRHLGLLIVDRPEEDDYRNEGGFAFNTPYLAAKRAEIESVPLVFGSVAPPLEIMKEVEEKIVDMRMGRPLEEPKVLFARMDKGRGKCLDLPEELVSRIAASLRDGKNAVIHSPRRAYAANLGCSVCGRPLSCVSCGGFSVTYNRDADMLACGSCKRSFPYAEVCPSCNAPFIRFFDVGVDYLEARLKEAFPDAPIVRATGRTGGPPSELSPGAISGKGGMIVVGTHVLSKYYGLRADLLILHEWDDFFRMSGYRGRERAFQVFSNLLDAVRPRSLLVWSARQELLDFNFLLDPIRFCRDELERRRAAGFPPYERLFLVNILKRSERAGQRVIRVVEQAVAVAHLTHQMLGPIKARGRYSWRMMLKGDDMRLLPLVSSLYRLPGVHIEADPPYL